MSTSRAVFLDRDGVLNRNVFYADTREFESPRTADAVSLTAQAGLALRLLRDAGFLLILVSNQPNAAKGKCTRQALDQIHDRLFQLLSSEGAWLDAYYYCHHHPAFTGPCACRKPQPHFLHLAAASLGIDLSHSWMIGDRATDIACGRAAGTRTVWIDNGEGVLPARGEDAAEIEARGILDAVTSLLRAC